MHKKTRTATVAATIALVAGGAFMPAYAADEVAVVEAAPVAEMAPAPVTEEAPAPVAEASAAETPAEEAAPVVDTPVANTPVEAPVEETTPVAEEAPAAEEAPSYEVIEDEVPAEEIPVTEEEPVVEAPVDEVPEAEAPAEEPVTEMPTEEVPVDEAPVVEAPVEEEQPPVLSGENKAVNDKTATTPGTPVTIDITANDGVSSPVTSISFRVGDIGLETQTTEQGTWTSTNGIVTFTPAAGFTGEASIELLYMLADGSYGISTVTVNVAAAQAETPAEETPAPPVTETPAEEFPAAPEFPIEAPAPEAPVTAPVVEAPVVEAPAVDVEVPAADTMEVVPSPVVEAPVEDVISYNETADLGTIADGGYTADYTVTEAAAETGVGTEVLADTGAGAGMLTLAGGLALVGGLGFAARRKMTA